MKLNNVAVTGATGFIGAALIPALRARGAALRVLSRRGDLADAPGFSVLRGDLCAPASLAGLVEGAEVVLHLGGYAHATSRPDPAEAAKHRRINLDGTRNLFQAAAAAGVRRFVFVSSAKAGGEDPRRCLDEVHPGPVLDLYGRIKRATEDWLFEQGERHGVEISVLRPALVYGPGVKGNLAAMLRAIDRGRFPPLPDTRNVRSMVAVEDLVAALLAAAESDTAAGAVCILTDGEAYSTRRIYVAMADALGRGIPGWSVPPGLLRALARLGDVGESLLRRPLPLNSSLVTRLLESACYSSANAERCLGFRPRYRLEDVLPEMVRAYRGGAAPATT